MTLTGKKEDIILVLNVTYYNFYIRHGLMLKHVHKGIKFERSSFMKDYMKNTQLSAREGNTAIDKDFFKFMNNACFGRTMENPHHMRDVRLITTESGTMKTYRQATLLNLQRISFKLVCSYI